MSRQFKRILATFAAGETTATYTEQLVDENGQVISQRQITGRSWFGLGAKAMVALAFPSTGIAAGVAAVQFQGSFNPGDSGATWYDCRDEDGDLISVTKAAGDAVAVPADVAAFHGLRLLPVDSGGAAAAPGAVVFEIGVKE